MHFLNGLPCTWDGDKFDEEREVEPFEADLYFCGYSRGRSSAVIILRPYEDRNKKWTYHPQPLHYQVFMSDIGDVVKNMTKGRIKGKFIFVKKGANYGIQLYKDTEAKTSK